MSIVEKPPDLVIIDMKNLWKIVGPASSCAVGPRVVELEQQEVARAPATNRMRVVVSVSFTCSATGADVRHARASAKITGKPTLPRKTPIISSDWNQ